MGCLDHKMVWFLLETRLFDLPGHLLHVRAQLTFINAGFFEHSPLLAHSPHCKEPYMSTQEPVKSSLKWMQINHLIFK